MSSTIKNFQLAGTMVEYLGGHAFGILHRVKRTCALLRFSRGAGYLPVTSTDTIAGTGTYARSDSGMCVFEQAVGRVEEAIIDFSETAPLPRNCPDDLGKIDEVLRRFAVPPALPTFEEMEEIMPRDPDFDDLVTVVGIRVVIGELLRVAAASARYLRSVGQVLYETNGLVDGECTHGVNIFLLAVKHAIGMMEVATGALRTLD